MNRPAVVSALCWILGSVLAVWGIGPVPLLPFILTAGTAGAVCFLRNKGWGWLMAGLLLAGGNAYYYRAEAHNRTAVLPVQGEALKAVVQGTLDSPVEVDGDRAVFYLQAAEWTWEGDNTQRLEGERVYVTVKLLTREEQTDASRWRRGDRFRLQGTAKLPDPARNFGGFDFRQYLHRQQAHWTLSVKGASSVEALQPDAGTVVRFLRWNDRFREKAGERLDQLFPAEEAGYMKGLLIGVREDLDPERFREFSRLGLTHILAISGLHVAVYAWSMTALLRKLRATRETSVKAVLWTIPLYIVFTGSSPSVVRAGLTAMAGLYAADRGWLKDGLSLLGGAALAMLLWNPYYLMDAGFQLSFLVTAGLITGVPVIGRLLPVRNRLLNGSLTVALTAQLVSFPLSVYYFNQFGLTSLPANLLLVPLISFVVTPLGYCALLLSCVVPYGGRVAAEITSGINRGTFWLVERMDQWAFGRWIWPSPSLWWLGAYYALLGTALLCLKRRRELRTLERDELYLVPDAQASARRYGTASAAILLLFAALLVYGYSPYRLTEAGGGTVAFLDVGQGDSAFVRTPGGKHLLIDGGGTVSFLKPGEEWKARNDPYEVGRKTVVPLLKKRGVHKLDYIIISHEDTDHIGGLKAVVEEMPVGAILFNGTLKSSPAAEELFREALRRKIPLIPARQGTVIRMDARTELAVLNPPPGKPETVRKVDEQNPETLVGLLTMNGFRFLFTGDIGSLQEQGILERLGGSDSLWRKSGADVMKVPHHGSKNSSSAEWLTFWQPRVSVISAGKNNIYGHPHNDTLNRLGELGGTIYRTDLQGEIQFAVRPGELKSRFKLRDGVEFP